MSSENLQDSFIKLFENRLSFDEGKELLVFLHKKGETQEDISIVANIMRSFLTPLHVREDLRQKLVDVVGTGGDKSGSFNISSTVALLLASLDVPVAKHGSTAATSKSGSADMLETLGINLNLTPKQQEQMLDECGFIFMFAKNYHPAMKHIIPIRKSLPHPTIFNFLGPLCNPAKVERYVLGTYPSHLQLPMANVLKKLGTPKSCVVNSVDGLDEVSISDATNIVEIQDNDIECYQIKPEDFGLNSYPFESILGDTPAINAQITTDILQGKSDEAKESIVLLNTALALKVADKARDIKEGIEMGKEAIKNGQAYVKMKQIVEISNRV